MGSSCALSCRVRVPCTYNAEPPDDLLLHGNASRPAHVNSGGTLSNDGSLVDQILEVLYGKLGFEAGSLASSTKRRKEYTPHHDPLLRHQIDGHQIEAMGRWLLNRSRALPSRHSGHAESAQLTGAPPERNWTDLHADYYESESVMSRGSDPRLLARAS